MSRTFRLAPLLFLSGACSLVYQAAWMREFRLIFGASTLASAAVTAIFMGGLGLGSWWGGRWVDRNRAPLLLYGNLELTVAVSAALTPLLVPVVRAIYVGVGGSLVLGEIGASFVRLILSALVLALPTLCMGATLPAVIAAAVNTGVEERRPIGWLYGVNTLGAVFGTLLGTFVLIEIYGVRQTLWMAALVNVLVGLTGRVLSRTWPNEQREPVATASTPTVILDRPERILVAAAAVVGLVFFLMEIVWYRLLGPILGGSTFTFGLILALALLGIAVGGALHSLLSSEGGGTPRTLAVTCLLEALFLALPFAFADDLAILAGLLRSLAGLGLSGLALGWSIVGGVIIVPPAIVAGYQFPLLISLLRPRTAGIGSAVALGYGANTLGSIAGALLGGFGLLRLLSAPGAWRLAVLVLVVLAVVVVLLADQRPVRKRWAEASVPAALAVVVGLLLLAPGPSAAWRHSGIGAGRTDLLRKTPNDLEAWKIANRGYLLWETDGIETSVALTTMDDLAFVVNGKIDGSAVGDSGTQLMSGIVGAISHPAPRRALVIGLGTGTTAGWLASIPEMERVDVIEIEPAIVEVARRAAPVNQNVLGNPKVHLILRDAREVLLASSEKYDLIFSEPSNPYRIGIASLFSKEFYSAAHDRLNPGGVLIQWTQAYEISTETLRTVMATLADTFHDVEAWQTQPGDLAFVARDEAPVYDAARLRARTASEPFRSALAKAWKVEGVEGYLAYYVAGGALIRAVAAEEQGEINTDDHPILEFGFARGVGRSFKLTIQGLRDAARAIGADRPVVRGDIDWERVEQVRMEVKANWGHTWALPSNASEETRRLSRLLEAWKSKRFADARRELEPMLSTVRGPIQVHVASEVLAHERVPAPEALDAQLQRYEPQLRRVFSARRSFDRGDVTAAANELEAVISDLRTGDPWEVQQVAHFGGALALQIARKDPSRVRGVFRSFEEPFVVFRSEVFRRGMLGMLSELDGEDCLKAVAPFEPNTAWAERPLTQRLSCYERYDSPLLARARDDLARFRSMESSDFRLRGAGGEHRPAPGPHEQALPIAPSAAGAGADPEGSRPTEAVESPSREPEHEQEASHAARR